MTDNEIIKALECCRHTDCENCGQLHNGITYDYECKSYIITNTLDLINRQKAEIERLNKEVDRLSQCVLYHEGQIVDAVKDFAERLKDKLSECHTVASENLEYIGYERGEVTDSIDNLVKEMTESECEENVSKK